MKIAIYQINPERDHNRVMFAGLGRLPLLQGNSLIDSAIYDRVFDGEVSCQNLEEIYRAFNTSRPDGHKGRSMSVSDVVEIISENGASTFYYVQPIGFEIVDFEADRAGGVDYA